ncbi:ATP-binding cassette domain-containing protein [Streptococcus pneumoniae D39]|nr:ATP-binding cassette domain-containing protein [Streptococcus pneumoniae D39]
MYKRQDKAVIENLSFNLEEGKSYALVGSSGSGKSTVAKLISGLSLIHISDSRDRTRSRMPSSA